MSHEGTKKHETRRPELRLTAGEVELVFAQVVALTSAGLPLAAGLRAAATESRGTNLAAALNALAARLEEGQGLDKALDAIGRDLPPHLLRLVAAVGSGAATSELLAHWIEQQQLSRELARELRSSLAYPLFLLGLGLMLCVSLPLILGSAFGDAVTTMGIRLTYTMQVAMWLGGPGGWILLAGLALSIILPVVVRMAVGPARFAALLDFVPVVGPTVTWVALADWCRTLAILIDAGVPLPTALRQVGGGGLHPRISLASHDVAALVESGSPLSTALADSHEWPASAALLVRAGEQAGRLAGALRSFAEICEGRVRLRSRWLRLAIPPLAFSLVGAGVVLSYTSFVLPFIQTLTAWM